MPILIVLLMSLILFAPPAIAKDDSSPVNDIVDEVFENTANSIEKRVDEEIEQRKGTKRGESGDSEESEIDKTERKTKNSKGKGKEKAARKQAKEARKHEDEMQRESRKHAEEMERESRKHEDEMGRETDGDPGEHGRKTAENARAGGRGFGQRRAADAAVDTDNVEKGSGRPTSGKKWWEFWKDQE